MWWAWLGNGPAGAAALQDVAPVRASLNVPSVLVGLGAKSLPGDDGDDPPKALFYSGFEAAQGQNKK